MTPEARIASAAEVLDIINDGMPAEQALTNWARRSRFAGSKDRAAVRDHVFDALRRRRSWSWLGGGDNGRALMLGMVREEGVNPDTVFTGTTHALAPLSDDEVAHRVVLSDAPTAVQLDMPHWVLELLEARYPEQVDAICTVLRDRAPVQVRANLLKVSREDVVSALIQAGFDANPIPLATTAIQIDGNARGLTASEAFRTGLFDMQDAGSQAICERLQAMVKSARVLDYCAGGGGKALALAALGAKQVDAHDVDAARMKDIPARANRAEAPVRVTVEPTGTYDLVLCDAPCSGSGAWRRQPAAKWTLTPSRLEKLTDLQFSVLESAKVFVRSGGVLAYATCSLLGDENDAVIDRFLAANSDWKQVNRLQLSPLDGGDGFFLSALSAP